MSLAPGLYIHNIAELDGGNEPWRPASTTTAPPPPLEAPQNGRRTAPAGGSSDCRRWRVVRLPPLEGVGLPPLEGRRSAPDGGSSDCARRRVVRLPPLEGCLSGEERVPRGSGLETVDESGAARSRVDKVGPCPVGSSPCPQPWRSRSSRPRKPELRA